MEQAIGQLMTLGPLVLIAGALSVIVFYVSYRKAPEPKRQPRIGMYFVFAAIIAAAAFGLGMMLGIGAACFSDNAGNLCGLVGVFGSGPLLSGVAMFVFAFRWSKQAKMAP